MPLTSMDASRWVLASVDTEVQVLSDNAEHSAAPTQDQELPIGSITGLGWTLRRFVRRFGNQWVPGRVELSSDALEFRPRDPEASSTPIALLLSEVGSVEAVSKVFQKTVQVGVTDGDVLVLRCRSPYVFAEQLRMAAGAVRAMAP